MIRRVKPSARATLLAILFSILAIIGHAAMPQISSTDHQAVPAGETITFSGSGFSDTNQVTFFWAIFGFDTTFNIVSDTTLEVVFPQPWQPGRDHFVLIETDTGSTVSLETPESPEEIEEFTGNGPVDRAAAIERARIGHDGEQGHHHKGTTTEHPIVAITAPRSPACTHANAG